MKGLVESSRDCLSSIYPLLSLADGDVRHRGQRHHAQR
jgi:hypothetical protein